MDPARKELFVEGPSDRLFLNWVTQGIRNPNARVLEIDIVDVPGIQEHGQRARLLEFARQIHHTPARILILADADMDRMLERSVPENVILTDGRDAEGYILRRECLEKVIRLGLRNEQVDPDELLVRVTEHARYIGLLRLTSELDGLNLGFQRIQLERHVSVSGGEVRFNTEAYLRALLQNAGISLRRQKEINARVEQVAASHLAANSADLVHGKDAVRIMEKVLRRLGAQPDEGHRLLWCSFERQWAAESPNLTRVMDFLSTP